MPRLVEFNGITVSMYFGDHDPPHVHVFYAEHEVLLGLAQLTVLRGSMPARQLKLARAWVSKNRDELLAQWAELQA